MQTVQFPVPTVKTAPTGILEPANGMGAVSVASTVDDAPIIITVPSEVWATRLALKAEIAAREKAVAELDKAIGFPDAASVARPCRILVVNGNGHEVGKGSIFWFGGATVPPAWRRRIS